jgi:hypothetical protein
MTRPEGPMIAAVLGAVWLAHRLWARRARDAAAAPAGDHATAPIAPAAPRSRG